MRKDFLLFLSFLVDAGYILSSSSLKNAALVSQKN